MKWTKLEYFELKSRFLRIIYTFKNRFLSVYVVNLFKTKVIFKLFILISFFNPIDIFKEDITL